MKYKSNLKKLQAELVALQLHVKEHGLKVAIVFEGRDAAGKGGTIKAIAEKLNPNHVRVIAKGKPTDEENRQYYYQRWVKEMPREGEIVLFDRSWHTRGGAEKVMGYTTPDKVEEFMDTVQDFETNLVNNGVILLKYWLSITQKTQEERFHQRLNDPTKKWKLSPNDLASRHLWDAYTEAKESMFSYSHTEQCPWKAVDFNKKREGRLAVIKNILATVPYERKDYPPQRLAPIEVRERTASPYDTLLIN